jgi:hypothetical protein
VPDRLLVAPLLEAGELSYKFFGSEELIMLLVLRTFRGDLALKEKPEYWDLQEVHLLLAPST